MRADLFLALLALALTGVTKRMVFHRLYFWLALVYVTICMGIKKKKRGGFSARFFVRLLTLHAVSVVGRNRYYVEDVDDAVFSQVVFYRA